MSRKAFGAVPLILTVAGILALSGVAWYLFYRSNTNQAGTTPGIATTTSPTSTTENTVTPLVDISAWLTYADQKNGFQFQYPQILTLKQKGSQTVLNHSIPYKNSGACDMSGGSSQFDRLDDFNATFEIVPTRKPSQTDGTYEAGILKGTWTYEGAEGCGDVVYSFPLPNNKTLLVHKASIQALSGISTAWNKDEILKVPGVISTEQSDAYFRKILSTFVAVAPAYQELANLKAYTNTKYGFTIEYPASLILNMPSTTGGLFSITNFNLDASRAGDGFTYSLFNIYPGHCSHIDNLQPSKISINGIPMNRYDIEPGNATLQFSGDPAHGWSATCNEISFFADKNAWWNDKQETIAAMEKILSSFRY